MDTSIRLGENRTRDPSPVFCKGRALNNVTAKGKILRLGQFQENSIHCAENLKEIIQIKNSYIFK